MGRPITVALAATLAALTLATLALAAPPGNDNRADARRLGLPASVTGGTQESTVEANEPSSCDALAGSVWFAVTAPDDGRLVISLRASGDLDATVDAFMRTRSQLAPSGCDITDENGNGGVSVRARKGDSILIRVGQRASSAAGEFRLEVFSPQPAARAPGERLPRRGARGVVDSLQNEDDAWSRSLREGVTYRMNLARGGDACTALEIYPPGTRSFEDDQPVRRLGCGGYSVLTPGAGEGGRYSFRVVAQARRRGVQPYRLAVARAGPDDTAPGTFIRNHQRVRGSVHGRGIDVVDLYRFDVRTRSTLELGLSSDADLELQLLNDRGRRLATSGASIERQISPGRYFAAVRGSNGATGRYTLLRASRTITKTRVSINGRGRAQTGPGGPARIGVAVTPGVAGPVAIVIERFDPLAGWQFFRRTRTRVAAGRTSFIFRPPAVGRWRARAMFAGTRSAARSESGYANLLVAGPLRD